MKRVMASAIVVLLAAVCGTLGYSQAKGEQRVFDAESATLQNPVPVPQDVLQLLSTDADVKNATEGKSGPLPKDWFSASVISTARPSEKLYLVVGNGPLVGAHVTTFWLVGRSRPGSAPVVLLKAVADRLEVGKPDASGYPKVTAVRLTASMMRDTIYHFASGKYVPMRPGS